MTESESSASGGDDASRNVPRWAVCPACDGRGYELGFATPLVMSGIAVLLAWMGWKDLPTLMQKTRGYDIESTLIFSIGGPALFVYAWWKCLRSACDTCGGTGRFRRGDGVGALTDVVVGQTIAEDQLCHVCQYNVRTLSIGARCPECGEPIVQGAEARQRLHSGRRFRVELWIGAVFVVGLPTSHVLFGEVGSGTFFGVWILIFLVLKARESFARPSSGGPSR